MWQRQIIPVTRNKRGQRQNFCRAAKDLNVSYQHLDLVLKGKRKSSSLLERVKQLHPELLENANA